MKVKRSKALYCNCKSHAITVATCGEEVNNIELEWWINSLPETSIVSRIKLAWKLLISGSILYRDMLLTKSQARQLSNDIMAAISDLKESNSISTLELKDLKDKFVFVAGGDHLAKEEVTKMIEDVTSLGGYPVFTWVKLLPFCDALLVLIDSCLEIDEEIRLATKYDIPIVEYKG